MRHHGALYVESQPEGAFIEKGKNREHVTMYPPTENDLTESVISDLEFVCQSTEPIKTVTTTEENFPPIVRLVKKTDQMVKLREQVMKITGVSSEFAFNPHVTATGGVLCLKVLI